MMKASAAQVTSVAAEFPASRPRQHLYIVAVVLLWAVIYVPALFHPALLDDADSVHAEAAREMLLRHDWVTLYINGIRYLEKAPLMYWGMAASFKVFGVSEWTARLPVTLSLLGLLLAAYALGRRVYRPKAGLYAAVILATGFGPYIYTRITLPDVMVALWLTLSMAFFLRTLEEERPSRLACWGLAAACALNVLSKGLIGVVFPAAIIVIYLALTRTLGHLLRLRLVSSTLIFLAIAAPWHILAGLRNPGVGQVRGFFWFYFVNEHFLRYLNARVPRDYDTVPLLVFWALVILWLVPWTAFLPHALAQVPHRLRDFSARLDRAGRASLLFTIWAVVIVGFFSFSTRQEYYTIPALPAIALLVGGWLAKESDAPAGSPTRRAGRKSAAVLLALGVAGFAVAMLMLGISKAPPAGMELAELLKRNPDKYALSFGHVFDLTPQALGAFRGPLLAAGVALLAGTLLGWWLRRRGSPARANIALALMMVALLFSVHAALISFSPILSSKGLAMAINRVSRPGDVIVIRGEYEAGSTLNFYTGHQVRILNGRSSNLWYGSFFPDAPRIFADDASFARLWDGPQRVFLWTDVPNPPQLEGKPHYETAREGGKYIYSNRLN